MLELLDMLVHNNVVQALILVGILWLIAKDEANLNLGNMCALLFFSFAIGWAAVIFLFPHIGIFGIVAKPLIFILLIKIMCWVRYRIAFAATALYVVVAMLLNVALFFGHFLQQASAGEEQGDLLAFAQGYMADQFAKKEALDGDDLYADTSFLAEEDADSAIEPDSRDINLEEKHETAGKVNAPLHPPSGPDSEVGIDGANPAPGGAAPVLDENHLMSRRKIVVSGRFTSPKGEVAMIKNEMVGVGETVDVRYKGHTYTWRLAAFEKGRISWEPVRP